MWSMNLGLGFGDALDSEPTLGSAVNRLEAKFMLGSHGDSDDGVEDLWVECENDPRFDVEAPACAVPSASRVVLH